MDAQRCAGCAPPGPPPTATSLPVARCGGHSRYRAGCSDCRAATAARGRAVTRAKAYGRWHPSTVDAAPTRAHIEHLRGHHGMTLRRIAETARVSHTSVDNIAVGRVKTVTVATATAVLATRPAPPKPGHHVDATGPGRMLQALAAIGYDADALAPLLGDSVEELCRVRRMYRPLVCAHRAASIRALYDRLEGTHGPSDRARAQARLRNWAPPLAWEDRNHLDDPDRQAEYSSAAVSARIVERAVAGDVSASALNEVERHATVARLVKAGLTARQIGDRLSWSGGGRPGRVAVAGYLKRAGLSPVAADPRRRKRAAVRTRLATVVGDGHADQVAIDRVLRGERQPLTPAERHHAVYAARARGMSFQATADALRMSAARARELYNKPLPEAVAA